MTRLLCSLALSILFSISLSAQAAEVAIDDIHVPLGTQSVDVPLLIAPTTAGEMVGAMNIFFSAGEASDFIPLLNTGTEFDGSIWEGGAYIGFALTPTAYFVRSAVSMTGPLEVGADGILITYTLDTSSLPAGNYVLDPNVIVDGRGTEATDGSAMPIDLTFVNGTLSIQSMQLLVGDYNGNGTVEQADLDLVLLNWGQPGIPNGWVNDLPEGNIDQAELDGVLLHWGDMADQMAAAGVPEPSTSILAGAVGVIAILGWRRRRLTIA